MISLGEGTLLFEPDDHADAYVLHEEPAHVPISAGVAADLRNHGGLRFALGVWQMGCLRYPS